MLTIKHLQARVAWLNRAMPGVEWAEGRLRQVEVRPGGRRFVATWLAALPRGVRVGAAG